LMPPVVLYTASLPHFKNSETASSIGQYISSTVPSISTGSPNVKFHWPRCPREEINCFSRKNLSSRYGFSLLLMPAAKRPRFFQYHQLAQFGISSLKSSGGT